jgi:glycine betaine/choline ABC-type transport system substrate-binding protein
LSRYLGTQSHPTNNNNNNNRDRLAVSKRTAHRVHMERLNLKKLNEVEGKEQYCVEISNRFAALENLDTVSKYGIQI